VSSPSPRARGRPRVALHCVAGISRSAAAALAVMAANDVPPAEAPQRLSRAFPMVFPNRALVEMIEDLIGAGRAMSRRAPRIEEAAAAGASARPEGMHREDGVGAAEAGGCS